MILSVVVTICMSDINGFRETHWFYAFAKAIKIFAQSARVCETRVAPGFFFYFFFFIYNFTFIDKTNITVAKFKTKRKYISILQIGSKLHKDEKEKYSSFNNTHKIGDIKYL